MNIITARRRRWRRTHTTTTSRSRTDKTKVFVGEWATRVGSPTPNMAGALGDAAWMTGMERNSDLVLMSCYAPLFVNVSDLGKNGSMQWKTDLIGYDALTSYGSPAYYAQKMFSTHHGDAVLATDSQDIPDLHLAAARPAHRDGVEQPRPPAQRCTKAVLRRHARQPERNDLSESRQSPRHAAAGEN